jgi:hypothetical protein
MGHFQIVMAAASVALAYGGTYVAEQLMDRVVGNSGTEVGLALEEDGPAAERPPEE